MRRQRERGGVAKGKGGRNGVDDGGQNNGWHTWSETWYEGWNEDVSDKLWRECDSDLERPGGGVLQHRPKFVLLSKLISHVFHFIDLITQVKIKSPYHPRHLHDLADEPTSNKTLNTTKQDIHP